VGFGFKLKRVAYLLVGLLGAGSLEDGAAGHEHVHARLGDRGDVVHGDTTVCEREFVYVSVCEECSRLSLAVGGLFVGDPR
jgi:hypothetical protein